MKTGDILLVHSTSTMAKIIQKFQQKRDKEAGFYNHSGIIYEAPSGFYVVEEAEIEGYKFKASVVFAPIEEYLESDRTLMLLERLQEWDEGQAKQFERILLNFVGIPYDYGNLLIHQIVRLTRGKWIGRKKTKAWKKMVCHEFTMTTWDEFSGIFPDRHQAKVSDIFRSRHFKHTKLKGPEKIVRHILNRLEPKTANLVSALSRRRPVKLG